MFYDRWFGPAGFVTKLFSLCFFSYTKLGYAGNTEPQFIVPSCEYFTGCTIPAGPDMWKMFFS